MSPASMAFTPSTGNQKIERLACQLLIERIGAVNQRFHLRRHGIEVNGRRQHDNVRLQHLCPKLPHVVPLHTGSAVAIAGVAAQAPGELLPRDQHLFHAAPGFLRVTGKFVAQDAGIAMGPGTALQNQDLFHVFHLLIYNAKAFICAEGLILDHVRHALGNACTFNVAVRGLHALLRQLIHSVVPVLDAGAAQQRHEHCADQALF